MCTTSKSTSVKIIDFGLATKLDPNELVKISTGTAEFAAPEIVEREAVGFYTDMWAIGVLAYVLLSGLSPFAGASDIDTLKNVKACDWSFDEEAFKNVSEEGRAFIRSLLVKKKEKRLTAHECLMHPWLTGDHSHKTLEIARNRFFAIREKIRQKYANWNDFVLPMGRMSEFSSLRKLQMEKYRMQEVLIDRKCAAPRFVIKPQSTFTMEGQSARFTCRIISLSNCSVTWYHNNVELRQSVKYMKRYVGDDYTFIINRCKVKVFTYFTIKINIRKKFELFSVTHHLIIKSNLTIYRLRIEVSSSSMQKTIMELLRSLSSLMSSLYPRICQDMNLSLCL